MLAGNVAALLSPFLYIPLLTYIFGPENYDYESMKQIRRGDDHDFAQAVHGDLERLPDGTPASEQEENTKKLHRASRISWILTASLTLIFLVLWPMPLYGTGYVFSKKFFTGWCVVGILWLFFSAGCVGLYPLWEGRKSMARTSKGIIRSLMGRGKGNVVSGQEGREITGIEKEESGGNTYGKEMMLEEKVVAKE